MIRCSSCHQETGSFVPCCMHCGKLVERPKPKEMLAHFAVRVRTPLLEQDFFVTSSSMAAQLRRVLMQNGFRAEVDNLNL